MLKRKSNLPSPEPDVRLQKRVTVEERRPSTQNQLAPYPTRVSGVAFRISNIPCTINEERLLLILNTLQLNEAGVVEFHGAIHPNVLGWSFAPSTASIDAGRYMTATVTFRTVPIHFQFRGTSTAIAILPCATSVIIDKHFYGMTPFNTPGHPTVEYVSHHSRSP